MDRYSAFLAEMQAAIDRRAAAAELEGWARAMRAGWLQTHGDDAEVRVLVDRLCATLDTAARAAPDGGGLIDAVRTGLSEG